MQFGQFLSHDILSIPGGFDGGRCCQVITSHSNCFQMEVPQNDPDGFRYDFVSRENDASNYSPWRKD